MGRITTPQNQQLLTNVAVVRIRRGGGRFEIAAYPNQVQAWRDGVETDLSEVLQIDRVYTNVSHGKFAKKKDLTKAFGTGDEEEICRFILEKGEIQVSSAERQATFDRLFKEIAAIVAEKCINTETRLPLTVTYVERALKELNFNVNPTRAAKQQALLAIPALKQSYPIDRARMRVRVAGAESGVLRSGLEASGAVFTVEAEAASGLVLLIDPGSFRQVDQLGGANVEILDLTVMDDIAEPDRPKGSGNKTIRVPAEPEKGAGAEQCQDCGPKPAAKGLTCKNCGVSFSTRDEHREHFKSEWHRHNLKMKSQGCDPISLEEFEFEQLNL